MVRIFSDSTSDLTEELIQKYQITILPLHICLGDKEYRDRVEILPDEIYAWAEENNTTPKTSAVSMEDTRKAFESVLAAGDEIVAFCISSQMSTTGNIMRLVAEELDASDKVMVIDSKSLSTGIGLLVIEAAIMAAEGQDREAIRIRMERLIPRVRASFVVDTLTYLYRGGRCSAVAALAGGVLKLHPKIVVENGAMAPTKKYRGRMQMVIRDYVKDLQEMLVRAYPDRVFITHSGCDEEIIEAVKKELEQLAYFQEIHVTRAGGVISSHCGPGTLGVLFLEKPETKN